MAGPGDYYAKEIQCFVLANLFTRFKGDLEIIC